MTAKPRAVLDTNIFVSSLISPHGPPAKILQRLREHEFILITSPPINEEIIAVLNRPWLRDRYGLEEKIFDLSFILWEWAEVVTHLPQIQISKDPSDDKFLAAAIAGKADYLITGDIEHLLHLREYRNIRILSPREFIMILHF